MGPLHESLRLYQLCRFMEWSHLPVAGGLYQQHPKFLDDMLEIAGIQATCEERKREIEKRKAAAKKR